MTGHIKLLGILHIVMGAVGLVVGVFVLVLFGGIALLVGSAAPNEGAAIAVPILGTIGLAIASIAVALSLPGVVAGFGLLFRAQWARILTIVLSGFELLNFPIGSMLGAYGLWVLLSPEGERAYRQIP